MKEEKIFLEKSAAQAKNLSIELDALRKVNATYLEKFVPSIGNFKMNDIVQCANKYLDQIQNDKNFKEYIIHNRDDDNKILKIFLSFYQTRSNN
ncbi:UNVERIFIED_CONTAM: hypothetical protein O8I53_12035 [Campylobacter lari]